MDPLAAAALDLPAVTARLGAGGTVTPFAADPTDSPGLLAPTRREPWSAATAIILAPGDRGLAIAFIQRVERPGDRWSGQMALPGGKRDPEDPHLAATAIRETAEEVGLRLSDPIGRLPDQRGRVSKGAVATFVHALDAQHPLEPQPTEVAAADWIDLAHLFDPTNATRLRWAGMRFPGIAHRDRVIWGLTHRILGDLGAALDLRLPRP